MAETVGGLIIGMGMDISKMSAGAEQARQQARITGAAVADGFAQGAAQKAKAHSDAVDAVFEPLNVESRMRMRKFNFLAQSPHRPGDAGAAMYGAINPMLGIGGEIGTDGGRGAAVGRGIAQFGFAAQDFASVLEGGGKGALSRALQSTMNNVQMLGAAFGPWGMALTAIGGALGSVLIPRLLQGKTAFEELGEAAAASVTRLSAFVKRGTDMIGFRDRVADIGSAKEEERLRKEVDTDRRAAEFDYKATSAAAVALDKRIADEKKIREGLLSSKTTPGLGETEDMIAKAVLFPAKFITASMMDIGIKGMESERAKLDARMTEVSARISELDEMDRELEKVAGRGAAADRKAADEKELDRKQEAADQLVLASRSQFEVAQDRLREIEQLSPFMGGPENVAAAADKVLAEFKPERNNRINQAVSGGEFGTAQGFSEIMRSIRQDQGSKEDEQVRLLREAVATLKTQLAEATKANKNAPIVERWR